MNNIWAFLTVVILIVVAAGLGLSVSEQFHTQEALTQKTDALQLEINKRQTAEQQAKAAEDRAIAAENIAKNLQAKLENSQKLGTNGTAPNSTNSASQTFPMLGMAIGTGTVLPFGMAMIAAVCLAGYELYRRQTKSDRFKDEMESMQREEYYQWLQYQNMAAANRSRYDRYRR